MANINQANMGDILPQGCPRLRAVEMGWICPFSSLSPGGLSNYWTAAVPRFSPEDFTSRQVADTDGDGSRGASGEG